MRSRLLVDFSSISPQPDIIGGVSEPDFAVAPKPETMFAVRAMRFRSLAEGHPLGDYLSFLGRLCDAQHAIQQGLALPESPDEAALERSAEFGMPPVDRARIELGALLDETFLRLLADMETVAAPAQTMAARARLAADPALRRTVLAEALENSASVDALAEHVFAAAALQVHFARLAAAVGASRLVPVGAGACPCCGGAPVSSLLVSWSATHGSRYVACGLCGTLWNQVRVRCVICESTKGIAYYALSEEGEAVEAKPAKRREDEATAKAETCDACKSYLKIFYQTLDPQADPVADDVATLGLDLKVREGGWGRAAFNPFLLGY
ncbi:formate dehydrogenase accessory protein FdhE [Hansschlegelia quercus]|uniref:Protein FdhE homolog n=1 Tax=Hansschlegelia quercus TaxID=2528245 RepID=A0A4Q9GE00_9HYPH|nr:formate dehydrogenase accessory protein FdhE [Hansschlegelia quercus]TBN48000.1 formate dehydrogenase accessory protein FdhE [Hansschlegelia quercus]